MPDYVPTLPNPLKPPIPDLTTLADWKAATDAGALTFRNNEHTLSIDKAIKEYHASTRLWHKYIALDRISTSASRWIESKEQKKESSRRGAYATIIKHVLALRRYPNLEPINLITYRGDTRTPAEIFQSGFASQKLSPPISIGQDGHTWQNGAQSESQVVSTSLHIYNLVGHYAAGGYLYAVKANNGIDLRENGDNEIALLGVPNTDVIAAIGKLTVNNRAQYDGELIGPLMFEGAPGYFENNQCTVPAHESRMTKIWLKKLAGRQVTDGERVELVNMLQAM